MNISVVPPLISSVLFIILGLFVFFKNSKQRANQVFGLVCVVTFWWQFCWFILFSFGTEKLASVMVYLGYTGIIFIPYTFYHFFAVLLKKDGERFFVLSAYLLGFVFLFFNWTTKLFIAGYYKYTWGYYPKAGYIHMIYLLSLFSIAIRITYLLYQELLEVKLSPFRRNQIKYILCAFIVYSFASIDFVVNYGLKIYPIGFIFIIASLVIIAYSIIKYRLMDIRIALTRAGIFAGVYTPVLGVPLWFGYRYGLWMHSTWMMLVLATLGPFIYIRLNRRAEDTLLQEQRRYQNTLKQASIGMTQVRSLRRLLNLIAHIVTRSVKISYIGIYLYSKETDEYLLQVARDRSRVHVSAIRPDNPVLSWIQLKRAPLVYEEVKRLIQDSENITYRRLEENMRLLAASVISPCFLDNRLLGFIVLGDKASGQIYTPEDLNIFQVLASQAALAIENAQFYEEAKQMQEQVAQAEKMATIGTMADGLSHQINNRFYALALIAGDTIDSIKYTDTSGCSSEVKDMITSINRALDRIQANVIQGGEVVKGILKYTRKGDEGMEAITMDQVIDATLEMVQYKIKLPEIDIIRSYPKDTPKIRANIVQLQEAFFNFIDNAYDAIVERRDTLNEEGYRGSITFNASPKGAMLEIVLADNGMGIKESDLKKVFTPFFTTKVSSRRGTGLGLYVIKRVIEEFHGGKIMLASEFQKGTTFTLEIPLA